MASHTPRPSNCSPMVQTRYHQLIKAVEHVTDLEFEVVEAEILPEVLALIEAARTDGHAQELLEACRELTAFAKRQGWFHVAIESGEAAIAKAEGKET